MNITFGGMDPYERLTGYSNEYFRYMLYHLGAAFHIQ
jgi:hypothetical protein